MNEITVLATNWSVSYETSSAYEGCKLNVHRFDSGARNEWGGWGVIHRHPEHDGRRFATADEARAYALEHGLVTPWCSKCRTVRSSCSDPAHQA